MTSNTEQKIEFIRRYGFENKLEKYVDKLVEQIETSEVFMKTMDIQQTLRNRTDVSFHKYIENIYFTNYRTTLLGFAIEHYCYKNLCDMTFNFIDRRLTIYTPEHKLMIFDKLKLNSDEVITFETFEETHSECREYLKTQMLMHENDVLRFLYELL